MENNDLFSLEPTTRSSMTIDVRGYLKAVWRYRWLVLVVAVGATLYGTYHQLQRVPVFTSTARILIESGGSAARSLDALFQPGARRGTIDFTQLELLESRAFIQRVVDRQGLLERFGGTDPAGGATEEAPPASLPGGVLAYGRHIKDFLVGLVTPSSGPQTDESVLPAELRDRRYTRAINVFRASMTIQDVVNTNLVDISWRSTDPVFATQMANAIASEFVAYNLENEAAMSQQASEFLSSEISRLRTEIQNDETELDSLAEKLGLDEGSSTGAEQELSAQYAAARSDRVQKEAVYRQMQEASPPTVPEVRNSEAVRALQTERTRLQRELDDLSRQLTSEHPRIKKLVADIADVEAQLASEQAAAYQAALRAARDSYEAASRYESRMRSMLEGQRVASTGTSEEAARYDTLRASLGNKRDMLDQFLQRQGALELDSRIQGYQGARIRIVDRATLPLRPSGPNLLQTLLTTGAIGLLLGAALALGLDYLDNTLRTPEDVNRRLGLTPLATISSLDNVIKANRTTSKYLQPIGELDAEAAPELIAHEHPRSAIAEEYRGLRTSLLLSTAGGPPQRILVTSAEPGEGKTTVATNLGASMAHAGKKVLLIDGDMRRPRLADVFGDSGDSGLANYLAGNMRWPELIRETPIPNLWVITSGPVPPNPAELFASDLISQLLEESLEHFDFVIVDSPPVMTVVDPLILAPTLEGVVLVIRAGATRHQLAARARAKLDSVRAKLLGVVLNQAAVDTSHGYYYSRYYAREGSESERRKSRRT